MEQIRAFGLEWLKEKLHFKKAKHDFRVETALALMERHGVVEGTVEPLNLEVVGPLPEALRDPEILEAKLKRDQLKLHTMVRYVREAQDPKAFIHDYFGLPYP